MTQETAGWEVSTACDIRLGPLFAEDNVFNILNIDEAAIAQTLEELDPGSGGKLHFEAVAYGHDALALQGVVQNRLWISGKASHAEQDPSNASVAVAIGGTLVAQSHSVELDGRMQLTASEEISILEDEKKNTGNQHT